MSNKSPTGISRKYLSLITNLHFSFHIFNQSFPRNTRCCFLKLFIGFEIIRFNFHLPYLAALPQKYQAHIKQIHVWGPSRPLLALEPASKLVWICLRWG